MKDVENVAEGTPTIIDASSMDAIVRGLADFEPNWKWLVSPSSATECTLRYHKQGLETVTLVSAEHSVCLEAVGRRAMDSITVYFVLSGEIQATEARPARTISIPCNHVASVRGAARTRLTIGRLSSWFALQIPTCTLRRHFEDLTGLPYLEEFVLSPTNFREGTADGVLETLEHVKNELARVAADEKTMLSNAYERLLLVKLFTKLPHNLSYRFDRGLLREVPKPLLKANSFMRENLFNRVTLQDLSDAAGCNARALQRMFYTFHGKSPIGALCDYRLAAAHSAIKDGSVESIAELARRLQFSNPGRFSALYKKAYGRSPSFALGRTQASGGQAGITDIG